MSMPPPPPHENTALTVPQALARLQACLPPPPVALAPSPAVPLHQALGRVLALDVVAPIDVPAHDNAAMDGYAFAHPGQGASLSTSAWPVVGQALAGRPFPGVAAPGQAVRTMTGAVIPAGCDTVVPQELCTRDGDTVHFDPQAVAAGAHRRPRGEDLARGSLALPAGHRLRPADLGLLASLGLDSVPLHRRLRVAVFSTGDELRGPGEALPPGSIHDSNRPALLAAVAGLGAEALDFGRVGDDPAALRSTLQAAADQADLLITSGGVSVGDADHTREVLADLGQLQFWKVAMRPGRPLAFGTLAHAQGPRFMLALPGNPVAAMVAFQVFARPALLHLAGALPQTLPRLAVRCTTAIRKRPGRSEFPRGRLHPGPDGQWQVQVAEEQGSGILRSLSDANCLVLLDHDQGGVAPGDTVQVWVFDGLF
ncbi:MAG: gephyrin-like molybdotransferase Glp [Rubrivivax sp.]